MTEELMKVAKDYVDKQIAIMKKYGDAPRLSTAKYDSLIREIADITLKLRRRYKKG